MGRLNAFLNKFGLQARESAGVLCDSDDLSYRSTVASPNALNDPTEAQQDRHHRQARILYFRSPMGGAVADALVDGVIGAGVEPKAKDPDVQALVDYFWNDPYNGIPEFLPKLATELKIFGRVVLPISVTPANGDVRLGYLNPDQVMRVVWERNNAKRAVAVLQRRPSPAEPKLLWIVPHPDPAYENRYPPHPALAISGLTNAGLTNATANAVQAKEAGEPNAGSTVTGATVMGIDGLPVQLPTGMDGQVLPEIAELLASGDVTVAGYAFYHRGLSLVGGDGHGIFERIADYLKAHDDWFFGMLRNAVLQSSFVWDLTITGASPAKIAAKKTEFAKPARPGSTYIHNQDEKLDAVSPKLQDSGGIREIFTACIKVIGQAVRLPGHELGAEDDTNRATAGESRSTSLNAAKRFQKEIAWMILCWIGYMLDQKRHLDLIGRRSTAESERNSEQGDTRDYTVEIVLPELDARDEGEIATSVKTAAEAMDMATQNNHILDADARRYLYSLIGQDLPPEKEFAKQQAEIDEKNRKRAEMEPNIPVGSGIVRQLRQQKPPPDK